MKTYAKGLEEVLGVGVNVELTGLGLGDVESGDLRNVLKLEGDTADGTTLDALHQVGSVTSDLEEIVNQNWSSRVVGSNVSNLTLLRRRLEAMMAISSQIRLLVSKSRVNLG